MRPRRPLPHLIRQLVGRLGILRHVGGTGVLRDAKLVEDRAIVSRKGDATVVTRSPRNDRGARWIGFTEYPNSFICIQAGVLLVHDVAVDDLADGLRHAEEVWNRGWNFELHMTPLAAGPCDWVPDVSWSMRRTHEAGPTAIHLPRECSARLLSWIEQ